MIKMKYFLQGLTMGFAYVAPIGVQNLFVINNALTNKLLHGIITSLIVVFFDITLALGCFLGIGSIMSRHQWLQLFILGIGGLIVTYIGIGLIRKKAEEITTEKREFSLKKTITSACIVTWFNPQAIIDGTMIFGAFYVSLPRNHAYIFISGVMTASFLWFVSLSIVVGVFNKNFNKKILRIINVICGIIIVFYGVRLIG